MNLQVYSQGGIVIPGLHGRTPSNGAPISHTQHDLHCQSRHRGIVFGAEWQSMQQRTRLHANRCARRRVTRAEAVAILTIEQTLTSSCIFGSSHREALPLKLLLVQHSHASLTKAMRATMSQLSSLILAEDQNS
jgi:hypothetical protein